MYDVNMRRITVNAVVRYVSENPDREPIGIVIRQDIDPNDAVEFCVIEWPDQHSNSTVCADRSERVLEIL